MLKVLMVLKGLLVLLTVHNAVKLFQRLAVLRALLALRGLKVLNPVLNARKALMVLTCFTSSKGPYRSKWLKVLKALVAL